MGFRGILGHEFVGRVVEGPPEWTGKRVVGEINFGCGACGECQRGMARHCARRTVMGILDADGAFAESIEVPVENLHEVPDGVRDEAAVFVEPLAAAFEILEQIHVPAGTECTVLGDGKLGLLVAQVLHLTGARVLVVGKHAAKLSFLAKRGIATTLRDAWSKKKADIVVEATGTAAGFEVAVAATRPRGKLVLKSHPVASEGPAQPGPPRRPGDHRRRLPLRELRARAQGPQGGERRRDAPGGRSGPPPRRGAGAGDGCPPRDAQGPGGRDVGDNPSGGP